MSTPPVPTKTPSPPHDPKHHRSPNPGCESPTPCRRPGSSLGQCSITDVSISDPCDPPGACTPDDDEQPLRGARHRGESWWRAALRECNLLLTLENSGSVARDHLASERTFLAYTRTSLTIASSGVALVQLFTLSAEATDKALERFARPLGAAMIILGLFTLAMGVARYFLVQNALIRGVYPVARVSTSLLGFVLLALILAIFVIVLAAR